ncbi:MAG: hypothetical protein QM756_38300 [Polyangiaceae bacterium]
MATEEDKTNTGALATLIVVGTFAMIGICLAVTAVTREELSLARAEREATGSRSYQEMRAEQKQKLEAGLPIEQAMQRVVQGLQRDPNSATPPAPAAAPSAAAPVDSAAAGSAAPAPSAAPAGSAAAPEKKKPAPAGHAPVPARPAPVAPPVAPAAPVPAGPAHG